MDAIVTVVIVVVITTIYLGFAVWNILISKKQIDVSLIDFLFYIFASFIFACSFEFNIKGLTLAVMIFVIIWSLFLIFFLERNEKYKIGGIIVERKFIKDDKKYVATSSMNFNDEKEKS